MITLKLNDPVFTMGLTERTKSLREVVALAKPFVSVDRAVLATDSYRETEDDPIVLRRAKLFQKVLREMPIEIAPGELVVGNLGTKPLECLIFPETNTKNIEVELDSMVDREWDSVYISETDKAVLREKVFPYWRHKSTDELVFKKTLRYPDISKVMYLNDDYPVAGTGIVDHSVQASMGAGHSVFNPRVLNEGLEGIRQEIKDRKRRLDLTKTGNVEKDELYEAMLISIDAVIEHAERYGDLAESLAAEESSAKRKTELLKIADVCRHVPRWPARDFYDTVQSFWFILMAIRIESGGVGDSAGRFDQWAYPFFASDLKEGKKQELMELIQCLWIKFSCINYWKKATVARFHVGLRPQHLCTGGITPDGNDASNDLSLMCLQASIDVGLQNPAIRARIHKTTAPEYMQKVADLIASGMGHPSIFNDSVCVKQCLEKGVPLEEARDYTIVGCPAVQIPAKEPGFSYGGLMNLAAAFELTLYNGVWQKEKRQIGPQTGDVRNFATFDELLDAYKTQVEYLTSAWQVANLIVEEVHAELLPSPFNSLLVDGCVQKGLDKTKGGAKYNFSPYLTAVGLADTVDSFAAIKKLIFEEKKLTWDDLFEALANDFERDEILRRRLIDRMPKYGNDDEYVDEIARKVALIASMAVKRYPNNYRGNDGPSGISLMSLGANVSFGKSVGAMPNGRRRYAPLADTSSPVHGCDRNGPTAILKSSSYMDHVTHGEPTILNLWFSPSALKDSSKVIPLLNGFIDLGVSHVQANVIDKETLVDAQLNPESHRTLLVRVSGYNAYFTELDKEIQDDIIGRTAYEIV